MIIGNNNFNENNNFQNKMNTIKENKQIFNNDPINPTNTNQYKDVNNRNEMLEGSFNILKERLDKGLISYDEFMKQCNKLRK